jgi:hypothetical protein
LDFWFDNIPSGNPVNARQFMCEMKPSEKEGFKALLAFVARSALCFNAAVKSLRKQWSDVDGYLQAHEPMEI